MSIAKLIIKILNHKKNILLFPFINIFPSFYSSLTLPRLLRATTSINSNAKTSLPLNTNINWII